MHFSSALTSYSIKGNFSVFIKVEMALLVRRLERNKFARLKKRREGLEQIMGMKEKAIFVVSGVFSVPSLFSFRFFSPFFPTFSTYLHLFWPHEHYTFFLYLILVYTFSLPPLLIPAWVTVNCFPFFVNSNQFMFCFLGIFSDHFKHVCVREREQVTHCMILKFILILPDLFRLWYFNLTSFKPEDK